MKNQKFLYLTLLALIICPVFLLCPSIRGNDGVLNYVYLRSLFFDGDLNFSNEYEEFDRLKNYSFKFSEKPTSPKTGLKVNRYGIGSSILWAPFFLVGHLICSAFFPSQANGYTFPYEFSISIASVFYVSIALLIIFKWLTKYFKERAVFWSIIFILFSTPLVFYTYFHPSMSHANSFFLATLFFTSILKNPQAKIFSAGDF